MVALRHLDNTTPAIFSSSNFRSLLVVAYQYCRGDDVDDEADDGDKVGCDPHRAKGHQPVPIPVGIDKFCSISKMQNK